MYIVESLKSFRMMDCKAITIPMALNLKLLSVSSSESVDATMYYTFYEARYFIYYEHIEACSPDGFKECSEVPEGYH